MTIIAPDRVLQTTVTVGTADYTLLPASSAFRNFSDAYSDGTSVPYCASDNGSGYEVGIGILAIGSPTQILRSQILLSSNGNAKVSWIGSTKQIFAWDTAGASYVSTFSGIVNITSSDWGTAFIFTGLSTGTAFLPNLGDVPFGFSVKVRNSGVSPCNVTPGSFDQIESLGVGAPYQINAGGWTTLAKDNTPLWRQIDAVGIYPSPGTFALHRVTTGTSDNLLSLLAPQTQISWESSSASAKTQNIPPAISYPSYELDIADLVGNANTYPITIIPGAGTIALTNASVTLRSPGGNITLRAHGPLNTWIIR